MADDPRFAVVRLLFEVDVDLSKSPAWGKKSPVELAHAIAEDWADELGDWLMERPVTESVGASIEAAALAEPTEENP